MSLFYTNDSIYHCASTFTLTHTLAMIGAREEGTSKLCYRFISRPGLGLHSDLVFTQNFHPSFISSSAINQKHGKKFLLPPIFGTYPSAQSGAVGSHVEPEFNNGDVSHEKVSFCVFLLVFLI